MKLSCKYRVIACLSLFVLTCGVASADDSWPFAILRSYGPYANNVRFTERVFAAQERHPGLFNEIWFGGDGGLDYTAADRGKNALDKNLGVRDRCHKLGIAFSYQQGVTLNHGSDGIKRPHIPEDAWVVNRDGKKAYGLLCCTSPWTHDYLRETAKEIMSRLQPDSYWPDDDMRLLKGDWHAAYLCFCDRCVKMFGESYGKTFTRESLVKALNGPDGSASVRKAWSAFNGRNLGACTKVYREAADAVSPKTRLGIQIALSGNTVDGDSWKTMVEALAGKDGKAGTRPGGLYYTDFNPRDLPAKMIIVAREAARSGALPQIGQICYEDENWPHVGGHKNAHAMMAECAWALAAGCDSIAFYWGADQNGEDEASYDFWLESVWAWRPFHLAVRDAFVGTHLGGVAAFHGENHWATKDWANHDEGDAPALVSCGVPVTVTEASPDALWLNERCVETLAESDFTNVFSRPILMSISAFDALAKRFPKLGFTKKVSFSFRAGEKALATSKRTNGYELFASGLKCENVKAFVQTKSEDVKAFSTMTEDPKACGTCVVPTEFGGKVVIAQEVPGHWPHGVWPGCRRHAILDALDFATPGGQPARLLTDGYSVAVTVRKTPDGRTAGVFLFNLGLGETPPMELAIRRGASSSWTVSQPRRPSAAGEILRASAEETIIRIPPMGAYDALLVSGTPSGTDGPAAAFRECWLRLATNPMPRTTFSIDASVSKSGCDAYTVTGEKGDLAFVGSNLRSLHFAVYDFFKRKGCRWYWDEDFYPPKGFVSTDGAAIREESRFEYRGLRYFAHRGLTRFQAEHWGPDEWKREIDWMLKNRLNVLMPRIGMDDTWQKAYPGIVPYPDASKRLPAAGRGFDDRSLFWPLEYRGKLRKEFTDYAFSRGLMIPTDFGTMTHWYSRTPKEYLDAVKPAFLPQSSSGYSEPTGRVFDVRDHKWYDVYWNLSEAFMKAGYGKPDLMHTIGLGERLVYTNRADNLALKIDVMTNLCNLVAKNYPDSKILLAGWDFYFTWLPDEVRALIPLLDAKRTLIWDYEADARDDDYNWNAGGGPRMNDFTRWDVIGKFPYTFGIFLCYESGIDVRLDYDLVQKRQARIVDDPMCKGYTLWPESSHTDILALEYFTANAWSGRSDKVPALLHDLCIHRYGTDAAAMEKSWKLLLPMTAGVGWGDNSVQQLTGWFANYSDEVYWKPVYKDLKKKIVTVPDVYAALKDVSFASPAVRRDALDVARTACDRMNLYLRQRLFRSFDAWVDGKGDEKTVRETADAFECEAARLADLLALHTDYSIWESFLRLDAVEKITNPNFGQTLFDNATTPYCRSHQYEMVRHWYQPLVRIATDEVRRRLAANERKSLKEDPFLKEASDRLGKELRTRPLESLRPSSPRTPAAFRAALSK